MTSKRLSSLIGIAAAVLLLFPRIASADTARIAVASNFIATAQALATAFEETTKHKVTFSFGSTGQLYAQISQGAPFDAFLGADRQRPERAIEAGYGVVGSLRTYAIGRLALVGAKGWPVTGPDSLKDPALQHLAIANPAGAPYGAASVSVLQKLGLYDLLKDRLVTGANIAQAYQFVSTGNAELGFVALSQVVQAEITQYWLVPQDFHPIIAQGAVLLNHGKDNAAAKAFLDFLTTEEGQAIIGRYGYGDQR